MKKYTLSSWIDQKDNPFEINLPLMEAPINLPMPTTPQLPPASTDPQPPPVDVPRAEPQAPMPGAGPVNPQPDPKSIPDNMEPEDEEPIIDFETEKIDYMNLSIKQKNNEMMDKLIEMRDVKSLSPGQYKFIEDNIQILSLVRDTDFTEVQKKVYKQIQDKFSSLTPSEKTEPEIPSEQNPDENTPENPNEPNMVPKELGSNPPESMEMSPPPGPTGPPHTTVDNYDLSRNLRGVMFSEADLEPMESPDQVDKLGEISGTELYSIISSEIEQFPAIVSALLKLPSFYSMKSDLFRKIIASITNGVQIGSGGSLEDLFIPLAESGVGIKVCTRCYTDFGNVQIGKWMMKFNDPENFLSDSELEKLNNSGSPEEKEVLRKRVVIESLAENFKDKIYIVLIIDPNSGERRELGFNFAQLLRDGWKNGYISVKFKASVGKGEAGVQVDGELMDLQEIDIQYVRENPDKLDPEGRPSKEYIELLKNQNGFIYLTIVGEDFDDFSKDAKTGLFYSSKPFDQGPEELVRIQRCIPDIKEILLRKC